MIAVINLDEAIFYLKEKSLYFEKLSNDKDFLYQEINNLPQEQINYLIDFYSDKIGPLNILRLTVLKSIQQGTKINEKFVQDLKDKFNSKDLSYFENYLPENAVNFINNYSSPKGGNPFQAWVDPFHSFYTFIYYGECKTKINQYYTEMANCLITELGLEDYKIDITGFDGPQNQGQARAWVNIFPNVLKNYNNAISYFFEVYTGKLFSGLSKSQKNKIDISIPQEFLSQEYSAIEDILPVLKQAKDFENDANNKLIDNAIQSKENIFNLNNEQENNLIAIIQNLYWYQAIGISMYMNGKDDTYRSKDLINQPIIAKYAKFKKSQDAYATLRSELQKHTDISSKTVNVAKRISPAIFDKDENAGWYLTEEGIQYIENNFKEILADLSSPLLYKEKRLGTHYWMLSAGEQAYMWDDFQQNSIIAIGWDDLNLGSLDQYKTKADIQDKLKAYNPQSSNKNNALCLWQFANEIQIGDIVFIKSTQTSIIGRGIVKSQYIYDENRNQYKHTRLIEWTHIGEWESSSKWAIKTLTDITAYTEDVEKLENMFNIEIEEQAEEYDLYTEEDFLNDVFMDKRQYTILKKLLLTKKNIILQGAPGVGKTYTAKRLCYSILGQMDTSKVEMIQFHQSYGYEDFIMGYRPSSNGFELKYGPFYNFCDKARKDLDNQYFFIIDEINRGKLSKIFGELLMLIEPDKRGLSLRLLYKDEQFSVPKNLHIIGMMNTADRSIAMIDYALRRRFAFYEFTPAFETDSFRLYKEKFNNPKYSALIDEIIRLNQVIAEDGALGTGFQIGHSYFCSTKTIDDEWLNSVVNYEIIPLLKEYWFDEENNVKEWTLRLKNAIK